MKATNLCGFESRAFGLILLLSLPWTTNAQGQETQYEVQGVEVLTRGPVHEAFAGMVTFNPEPGIVVTQAPPPSIEELPPEQRPSGDNVTWIPGYWAWDDEPENFLWISGTWRDLPPGREWMAGYWSETTQGHQWVSGYWADVRERETVYLPTPPTTLEIGSNVTAPSADHDWTPGNWAWEQERYAWRPGFWAQGRQDWDWIPAHYVWTPRGYVFIDGYWDYPAQRRGVLYAPVRFSPEVYGRRDYRYSPSVVIDLSALIQHLFLRPRHHHYYFGDYYDSRYDRAGYYSSRSFFSSRRGYDPIYAHRRWEHRGDNEWSRHDAAAYQYRRDHESARPPRTWEAQRNYVPDRSQSEFRGPELATSMNQLAARKGNSLPFQSVDKDERERLAKREQDVEKSRDERRTREARGADTTEGNPATVLKPTKVSRGKSPIAAEPIDPSRKGRTPPPAPRTSQSDRKDKLAKDHPGNSDKRADTKPEKARENPPGEDKGSKSKPTVVPEESKPDRKDMPAKDKPGKSDQRADTKLEKTRENPPGEDKGSKPKPTGVPEESKPDRKDIPTKGKPGKSDQRADTRPEKTRENPPSEDKRSKPKPTVVPEESKADRTDKPAKDNPKVTKPESRAKETAPKSDKRADPKPEKGRENPAREGKESKPDRQAKPGKDKPDAAK